MSEGIYWEDKHKRDSGHGNTFSPTPCNLFFIEKARFILTQRQMELADWWRTVTCHLNITVLITIILMLPDKQVRIWPFKSQEDYFFNTFKSYHQKTYSCF